MAIQNAIRGKIKHIIGKVWLKPLAAWYLSRDRMYVYKGICVSVPKGIFHPGLFFSTTYMCSFLESMDIKGKHVLELGAGSGMIALVAAKIGAQVTASDVQPEAIETIKMNFIRNGMQGNSILSDLFTSIPLESRFDIILVNPPYYPKNPKTNAEKAWFCGENFEYFHSLFAHLPKRIYQGKCYMVLSEDCAIEKIKSLAIKAGLLMNISHQKSFFWETNYIYQITVA